MNSTGPLLRRRALDLIDEALALDDVHEVRKRLKELRAITDLLRSRLPHHGREERTAFRDAGRLLAGARDAEAALEAFDALGTEDFATIREALSRRRTSLPDVHAIAQSLHEARRHVAAWPVEGMHDEEIWSAFRRTYRRSRKAMADVLQDQKPALFHEWRKRVKTYWAQARLIGDDSAKALHKLSTILGEHHDLAVIDQLLRESPETYGNPIQILRFLTLVAERMSDLEARAATLGHDLFSRRGPKRAERVQVQAAATGS